MRGSVVITDSVLAAVQSDAVARSEGSHQMPFECVRRASGEPARACVSRQFLVYLAVITDRVIRHEDHGKMVREGFIVKLREPAQAPRNGHANHLPSSA